MHIFVKVFSVNVVTVVYHLRNKNTFITDAFYVQYRCHCILLVSAIYEEHCNIVNLIFVSCCCYLANINKNEYNHCCYLYSLGGRQLCQNFEPKGLVTLTFDLESGVRVTCDVGYRCAKFSLPRPLCSPVRLKATVCRPISTLMTCRFTARVHQPLLILSH